MELLPPVATYKEILDNSLDNEYEDIHDLKSMKSALFQKIAEIESLLNKYESEIIADLQINKEDKGDK